MFDPSIFPKVQNFCNKKLVIKERTNAKVDEYRYQIPRTSRKNAREQNMTIEAMTPEKIYFAMTGMFIEKD